MPALAREPGPRHATPAPGPAGPGGRPNRDRLQVAATPTWRVPGPTVAKLAHLTIRAKTRLNGFKFGRPGRIGRVGTVTGPPTPTEQIRVRVIEPLLRA